MTIIFCSEQTGLVDDGRLQKNKPCMRDTYTWKFFIHFLFIVFRYIFAGLHGGGLFLTISHFLYLYLNLLQIHKGKQK